MSSEAWELVETVAEVTDGSQQVHLDACQIRVMSNWSRLVSVARHYYRLRHLMGVIRWCLKENKKYARDELFEQFPEVDPKRVEREAKAERRKRTPPRKLSKKQVAVADSSVPSEVIAEIESGHYKGTHWYKGKRIGYDDKVEIENSHYQ